MDPKIRFTARVRRGLVLLLQLVEASKDPRQPPTPTLIGRMKASQRADLQLAEAWIRQHSPIAEARAAIAAAKEVTND